MKKLIILMILIAIALFFASPAAAAPILVEETGNYALYLGFSEVGIIKFGGTYTPTNWATVSAGIGSGFACAGSFAITRSLVLQMEYAHFEVDRVDIKMKKRGLYLRTASDNGFIIGVGGLWVDVDTDYDSISSYIEAQWVLVDKNQAKTYIGVTALFGPGIKNGAGAIPEIAVTINF